MTESRTVRVLPDVSGLAKVFDYSVPACWAGTVAIGSMVRVDLHGRRVAGWVVALDVLPPEGVVLKEITKVSSRGPSQEILDLAHWTSRQYAGSMTPILRTASPEKMTPTLPTGPVGTWEPPTSDGSLGSLASEAFSQTGVTVVRVSPTSSCFDFVTEAGRLGDSVVITPSVAEARMYGGQVRRSGGRVALAGRDWGLGAAGGMVIGARKAVWATTRSLAAVLVLDEHDESLQEERNPTWNARDVAIERARRANVPCVLVSAAPSVVAIASADRVLSQSRSDERAGWPLVSVVDRRSGDPAKGGLFSSEFAELCRITSGRVLCILNRKGRAQMLSCGSCGELVRTIDGDRLMKEIDGQLVGPGGEYRPLICVRCSGTKLKRLRLGVSRAREELEALVQEPVSEVTSDQRADEVGSSRILIGTEALLHRVTSAEAVVFLDFDQELLAPRYRAAEQANALVLRAARLTAGRSSTPPGWLMIQTRTPDHRVLQSAVEANPARFVTEEAAIRESMGFPPFGALAEVSGVGADEFVGPLRVRSEVLILGPSADGKYLLRTDSAVTLADVLAQTPRPKGRMRVAVDPPRA